MGAFLCNHKKQCAKCRNLFGIDIDIGNVRRVYHTA